MMVPPPYSQAPLLTVLLLSQYYYLKRCCPLECGTRKKFKGLQLKACTVHC